MSDLQSTIEAAWEARAEVSFETKGAVREAVEAVVILDGRQPHAMLAELFSESGSGTLISA